MASDIQDQIEKDLLKHGSYEEYLADCLVIKQKYNIVLKRKLKKFIETVLDIEDQIERDTKLTKFRRGKYGMSPHPSTLDQRKAERKAELKADCLKVIHIGGPWYDLREKKKQKTCDD